MVFKVGIVSVYIEKMIDYEFIKGLVPNQRKKCIASLHKSIKEKFPNSKVLEISTKSDNEKEIIK